VEEILHTPNYIYKLKYIWKIHSSKVLKEMLCNNIDERNKMDGQQKTNDPKRQDRGNQLRRRSNEYYGIWMHVIELGQWFYFENNLE
jgi:hypothetical protein